MVRDGCDALQGLFCATLRLGGCLLQITVKNPQALFADQTQQCQEISELLHVYPRSRDSPGYCNLHRYFLPVSALWIISERKLGL